MTKNHTQEDRVLVDPALAAALARIEAFVESATGLRPEPEEISQALTKYFVLKEILEFIRLSRQEENP